MRFAWILSLFLFLYLYAGQLSSASASVLDKVQNGANAVTASIGGASFCGSVDLAELNAVDCATRAKFTGNRADGTRFQNFAEQLILNDLASDAQASVECHLPLLDEYSKQLENGTLSGRPAKLNQNAYQHYLEVRKDLKEAQNQIYLRRQKLQVDLRICGEKPAANCMEPYKKVAEEDEAILNTAIAALASRVPMGTSGEVRDGLLKMATADVLDRASFDAAFSKNVVRVRKQMAQFKDELKSARSELEQNSGYFYDMSAMPSVREQLMTSKLYEDKLSEIGTSASLKEKMLCRRDAEFIVGRDRATKGLIALSILSLGASTGATVVATSGALRTAHYALQLGISRASLAVAGVDFASKCLDTPTPLIKNNKKQCSAEEGFQGVIAASTRGECLAGIGQGLLGWWVAGRAAKSVSRQKWVEDTLRKNRIAHENELRVQGSDLEISPHSQRQIAPALKREIPASTVGSVRKAAEAPYATTYHVTPKEVAYFKEAVSEIPEAMRKPAIAIRNKLLDQAEWSKYMEDLSRDALAAMKRSPSAEIRSAAARGEISRNSILKVIVERERARGTTNFKTVTNLQSDAEFSQTIPKAFFDKAGGKFGQNGEIHGMDSHLIQRDFVARQANDLWPGGYQKYYEFMGSSKQGSNLFTSTFDYAGVSNPGGPAHITKMFNNAAIPMK